MPHFGHLPGLSDTTSGCIGQVYCLAVAVVWLEFVTPPESAWLQPIAPGISALNTRPAGTTTRTSRLRELRIVSIIIRSRSVHYTPPPHKFPQVFRPGSTRLLGWGFVLVLACRAVALAKAGPRSRI